MRPTRKSHEPENPPPWAGKSGPGFEFDEEGDLIWFASASSMAGREKLTKLEEVDEHRRRGGSVGQASRSNARRSE